MKKNNSNIRKDLRELSILVSLYGLSFIIKNNDKETKFFEYLFDKVNPVKLEGEFNNIIKERPILKHQFGKVRIIHHNNLNTLVPKEFFLEEKTIDYLKFNTTLLKNDIADFDKIKNHEIVNVYLPFININNLLLDYNKQINYYHSATMFIKKIDKIRSKQNILKLFDIYLNIFKNDFQILIYKNEDIIFCNSFEYQTTEDFLYFFFFVLESLNIKDEDVQYNICGTDSNFHILKDLRNFVNDWKIIPATNQSQLNNFIL